MPVIRDGIVMIFGEDAGIAYSAIMKRLFGVVVGGGGEMAVAAAESAIDTQIRLVDELAESLGLQDAAIREIADIVTDNQNKSTQLKANIQRLMTQNPPNRDAARTLATELKAIDNILPDLSERLVTARSNYASVEQQLKSAENRLNEMKAQQRANEATARVNQSLQRANKALKQTSNDHQRVFEKASEGIKLAGTTNDSVRTARLSVGSAGRAAETSSVDAYLDSFVPAGELPAGE